MKYFLNFIVLAIILSSCRGSDKHRVPVVYGVVSNFTSENIYLYKKTEVPILMDTLKVDKEGVFRVYKESVDTANFYTLVFSNGKSVNLFLRPDDFIQIHMDANNIESSCTSKNSKFMNALWNIERNNHKFQEEMDHLSIAFKALIGKEGGDSIYQSLLNQKDSLIKLYRNRSLEIVNNSKDKIIEWLMLNQKAGNVSLFDLQKDLKLFMDNSEKLVADSQIKDLFKEYDKDLMEIFSQIRSSERFSEGNEFIKLKARTYWNDSLPFEKLNAKLISVVLWTLDNDLTNCKFRQINKLQRKYNSKGLKTLFVAYEKDKEAWKFAISKLYSNYWHIIDTSATASADLIKLGVRSFPAVFLVDQKGKIIGRNLWGEGLEKQVSIFLKNN